eukprot:12161074-Heterocapsa_arctica.AAC.1
MRSALHSAIFASQRPPRSPHDTAFLVSPASMRLDVCRGRSGVLAGAGPVSCPSRVRSLMSAQ